MYLQSLRHGWKRAPFKNNDSIQNISVGSISNPQSCRRGSLYGHSRASRRMVSTVMSSFLAEVLWRRRQCRRRIDC